MNPLAVSLQVARNAGDLTTPAGVTADFSGTLLHEQHHWLQQLGTPAGIFNLLLLETQASYVVSTVDAPALTADDLPIADSPRIAPEHLDVWLRLEATRILFFGGRADDLQVLQDAGHPPLVGMLTQLLWPMVRRMPPSPVDTPEPNGPLRAWATNQPVAAPPEATTHGRYLVGASHLMEGAARTGELAFTSYTRRGALDAAWVASNLTGPYKVIWDMLTENDPPTTGRIAQLLYICDLGMCGALPPAFPPTGPFMHPAWAPGKHISTLIKLIRQLPPPADVDFASPDSMRAAIATFDKQLSEPSRDVWRLHSLEG